MSKTFTFKQHFPYTHWAYRRSLGLNLSLANSRQSFISSSIRLRNCLPFSISCFKIATSSLYKWKKTPLASPAIGHWGTCPHDFQQFIFFRSLQTSELHKLCRSTPCVTERFLSQPLVCGTVFHRTSLLPPLSPSSAVVLNHISSHFLIALSDSSLICTVPVQRVTRHFGHNNRFYI